MRTLFITICILMGPYGQTQSTTDFAAFSKVDQVDRQPRVIKMHPNPAHTYMIIEIPGPADGRTTDLYVWDMFFKNELVISNVQIGVPFMLDISTLDKGRHILRTEMDRNFSLGVFIKK